AFAILHEITAIVPLPLIYFFLDATNISVPIPESAIAEGNKYINRVLTYFKFEPLEEGSKALLNATTSYAIVKALMPVRIALCVFLTPWWARVVIEP
ncbi:hypothetical protein BKA69DRAFT_1014053, partial [Paraphysoderma sedebokerense]